MAASIGRLVLVNFHHKNPILASLQRLRTQSVIITGTSNRFISTISKNNLEVDPDVEKNYVDAKSMRKHPGVFRIKQATMPIKLQNTLAKVIDKYSNSVGDLTSLCENMINYLHSRQAPIEKHQLQLKAIQYEKESLAEIKDLALKSQEEMIKIEEKVRNKVMRKLKQTTYKWESIDYNPKNTFLYLASRAVSDYATIYRIFDEIKKRDPDFKPRGFYDFGSGIGTGMWALNSIWPGDSVEYFCVDISDDMHTLSRLVLQDGEENKEMSLKPVFFRQFAPASHKNKYELVLSAYTLIELPDKSSRIKAVMDLWKKTDKYLVLVENGTNAGFKLIREARDAILKASETSKHKELSQLDKEYEVSYEGHVFAPCPHDFHCPWPSEGRTPCNFEASHPVPVWGQKWSKTKKSSSKTSSRYSYVVLKKGPKVEASNSWPRVIRPISTPSKHVHCRLCCSNGKLEHHILTQRLHGKTLYKCARSSKWGDLLPAKLIEITTEQRRNDVSEPPEFVAERNAPLDDSTLHTLADEHCSDDADERRSDRTTAEANNDSILVMGPGGSDRSQTDIRTRRGLTLSGTSLVRVILNDNKTDRGCHGDDEEEEERGVAETETNPLPT